MAFEIQRIERILRDLEKAMYPDMEPIEKYNFHEGKLSGAEKISTNDEGWVEYTSGSLWGGYDKHAWFRTVVTIPERFNGKNVIFKITTGREGEWDALNPQFLFYLDGKLVQGLDVNHREILITDNASANREYFIALSGYSGLNQSMTMLNTELCVLDVEIEELYYNIKVPLSVAKLLDMDDENRIRILNKIGKAIDMIDLRRIYSEDFYSSLKHVNSYLRKEFYTTIDENSPVVNAIGNTHIDIAWLWTISQTREKAVRSYSTVLNLMKQYPEYRFMASQPQLYEYVKEDRPELYAEIKKSIREGKWEADGAMWLEADCNIPSGESLIRQILFGKMFFKEELDIECKTLWLPDVFGYSAAIPQILKKSGIDYFVTTKISWNQFNTMPNDTFFWRGIDGSEIFTYFVTTCDYDRNDGDRITYSGKNNTTTYTGNINANQVMGTWKRYQNKDINEDTLMLFGYGDGGGGPTKEMLENARRLKYGIPGCPRLQMGFQGEYLDKLYGRLVNNEDAPKWVGELYLEYHRGTYTSMAKSKRYNRKSELLYQDAEFLSVFNMTLGNPYPKEQINRGWKTILLNQFHDIIPGSSIKQVYDESYVQYEKILESGETLVNSGLKGITSGVNLDCRSVVVFNTLSYDRSDVVEVDIPDAAGLNGLIDSEGNEADMQIAGDGSKLIFFARDVPSKGYKTYRIGCGNSNETKDTVYISPGGFENRFFKIVFDKDMNIISLYDKENSREVIEKGRKGNVLQAFEDRPMQWENWDIDLYYKRKMWEVNDVQKVELIEHGPVRYCIRVERSFCSSIIEQYIYFYNNIPRIDFKNHIDWKEKNILLKVAFPVSVNSNKAAYEIQYGNLERETHNNTSWDMAKFEVCGHKWADLSEGGYGVSLLNDCKYGHDIKDGNMRLTLLKSGTYPNPDADLGLHEFVYSVFPHKDTWKEAGTQKMAYNLNVPMYGVVEGVHKGMLPDSMSLMKLDRDNCAIEVVKKAENEDGVIIRLYEYMNKREKVSISFAWEIGEAWECDLMENRTHCIMAEDRSFSFDIMPYEIKTFIVNFNKKVI